MRVHIVALIAAATLSNAVIAQVRVPQPLPPNPLPYDLLLQHGRLIDPKNQLDSIADVGMKDGRIVAVAPHLATDDAIKTLDLSGYVVIPGIIDIHGHEYR